MRIWAAPGSNAELPIRAWARKAVFAFGWIPASYTQNKQDEASRLRPVLHPENHRQASGSKEVKTVQSARNRIANIVAWASKRPGKE